MKKSVRKLTLHRETVLQLDDVAKVAAGTLLTRNQRQVTYTEPMITDFPCDVPVYTIFC